ASGRPSGPDRGGPRAGREAPSRAGGVRGGAGAPVRLLHARDDDDGGRAPREEPEPDGGRDPSRDLGEPVPVHGVREHRKGGAIRREEVQGRRAEVTVHRENVWSLVPEKE